MIYDHADEESTKKGPRLYPVGWLLAPLLRLFRHWWPRIWFLAVLLPTYAYGASVEICGNGVDDVLQTGGSANGTKGSCPAGYMDSVVGLGCDLKCPGVDQDNDGYTSDGTTGTAGTTDVDCDDTDRRVYPGVYVPNSWSSPTGYKLCQTSGSYGSTTLTATAALCEATNGASCYYIDCASGSNSNSGTSYSSPFLTLGKVAGGSPGSPPSSPVTLTAGAVVYIIGGTCSTTYSDGTYNVHANFTADGTSAHRITIKRYPGSTATITNTNGPAFYISGDYYNFHDLDISTQRSSAARASSIFARFMAYVNVSRSYIHDMSGHGDNNDACVMCEHTIGCTIDRSYFEDCKMGTGNVDNINSIGWLDDEATATECQNHSAKWNTIWYSTYDANVNGACFRQKHGCEDADVGSNNHPIQYNSCVYGKRGIYWNSSALRANDNFFYGTPTTLYLRYGDENGAVQDNDFSYNTLVDSSLVNHNVPTFEGGETFSISYNVMKDNVSSYAAGNADGIIAIARYGSDAQKTSYESPAQLTSNNNCFYNPNTSLVFSYFSMTSGTESNLGPAGAAGGNYTFAQWQSNTGQDAASFVENPLFDSYYRPTSTNCSTKGRRYTSSTVVVSTSNAFVPYLQ